MTNGWVDIKNTDMMLIMGGNPAENHPCGFKWAIEAKRNRNASMIVVDPRFTRTASVADLFLQIRTGTDIAFLGGLIRYAIENDRIAKDYLLNYTNAAFLVKDDFKLPEENGVFSGFDETHKTYDRATWNYSGTGGKLSHPSGVQTGQGSLSPPLPPMPTKIDLDLTLQNPQCVFQQLRKHYSRYTPEVIERITGIPKDQYLKAADLFTSIRKNGDMQKAATVIYAVGWTHHSFGTQIIRTAAMLQLLMGNVGRAGGGVNALRGHSNIQGATDMAGIFDNLPGYIRVPRPADGSFQGWMDRITPETAKGGNWESFNYWGNTPKFVVSQMKSFYGDAATKENGWAYDFLPKVDRNYSWVNIWDDMYKGNVKGLFAFGMNGVAIGPDSKKNIDALKKADWLVVGEIYPDETSEFWRSPGITADEMKNIPTTVYRLPCAGFAEKDGTFTNSARWLQWKNAALPMPEGCRLDQAIVAQIFLKVRDLYQKEGGKFPDPILKAFRSSGSRVVEDIINRDDLMPPAGRYNAGQKALFWSFFFGGLLLLASGLVLWFTESIPWSLRWIRYLAVLVHASTALFTIGNFMIHVYMGVFAERGAFGSVIRGDVSLTFAKRYHPGWYREIVGETPKSNDFPPGD